MKVYGHRGAAGEAPENTIAGCLHAIDRGTRYLELDLRLSRDDELVVIHDSKVNRTTYSRGAVGNFTAKELASMDARRSGPPWTRKRNTGVPTLEAILAATPEIKGFHLEVKTGPKSTMNRIAELLAERFSTAASTRKVVVTSSSHELHHRLRHLAPHIPLGLISMRPDVARELAEFDFQQVVLAWGSCNPLVIRHLRKQGVSVAAWTVNDPNIIKNLYRMKVDSVITDYPSMALPCVASMTR